MFSTGAKNNEDIFQRLTLKERNPWLTPTESHESDESEGEDAKPFRALRGLLDRPVDEVSRARCSGARLVRPRQRRATFMSIPRWNPAPRKGNGTNRVVISFRVRAGVKDTMCSKLMSKMSKEQGDGLKTTCCGSLCAECEMVLCFRTVTGFSSR